ncbi:hypothetical protein FHG87_020994 [Trinorchestia longiramus]|nr:hypothetical protein FHG87_020994 [Trinorchestia longiramus]
MSFSDNQSGSCKRNVSEILDGSEVLTASYPRKRHNYALPEKPSTISYYPKDSSEKRCVSGALSSVESSTCWPGSSSNQTSSTKMASNKATPSWKPWQLHSSPKATLANAPTRRKSSSAHGSTPPYVHPPLLSSAPSKFALERRVRHAPSVTRGSSNFKKRSIKDVNIGSKPPPFSKELKKTASLDSDEDQRPHTTGKGVF